MIELVVVVLIIGVMTAIIAPSFRVTEERRVENMAHLLVAHLELARTQALGNRQFLRVDFDVANRKYTAFADVDEDDAIDGSAAEIAAFGEFGERFLDDLLVFGRGNATAVAWDAGTDEVTLPSDQLLFDDQGLPSPWGTMGTIYITHERDLDAVAAVSIASSGAFKAWRWFPSPGEWR
jgi:type II secretory pathway pseudopilin PulG